MAIFVALGFAIENLDKFRPPVLFGWGLLGLSLVGSFGVYVLFRIDVLFYHQLLNAVFFTGLGLEDQHPDLPRLRRNMNALVRTQGSGDRPFWFYFLGVLVTLTMCALAATGLIAYFWQIGRLTAGIVFVAVTVVTAAGFWRNMRDQTRVAAARARDVCYPAAAGASSPPTGGRAPSL